MNESKSYFAEISVLFAFLTCIYAPFYCSFAKTKNNTHFCDIITKRRNTVTENTTFKHNDPDHCHGKTLTLHDCTADKVCFTDGILRFFLPDGLWVTSHHDGNNLNKTVRTGAAVVDFSIEDIADITVRVFTRNIFNKSKVALWEMRNLVRAINNGDCSIEFIYQYRANFEQMWLCAIRSKKKPHYRECHLHLPEAQATFRWNELRPEQEW